MVETTSETASSEMPESTCFKIDDTPKDITFWCGELEMVKLCGNGDIYVKSKLCENDKDLVNAFWEFLRYQKYI